jgi:hypothetical protein
MTSLGRCEKQLPPLRSSVVLMLTPKNGFSCSVTSPHSYLSATIGSTLIARRAGSDDARKATHKSCYSC